MFKSRNQGPFFSFIQDCLRFTDQILKRIIALNLSLEIKKKIINIQIKLINFQFYR